MKYVCNLCGWVYDEEEAGVKWEDLPDDFTCELCGAGKDDFTPARTTSRQKSKTLRNGIIRFHRRGLSDWSSSFIFPDSPEKVYLAIYRTAAF